MMIIMKRPETDIMEALGTLEEVAKRLTEEPIDQGRWIVDSIASRVAVIKLATEALVAERDEAIVALAKCVLRSRNGLRPKESAEMGAQYAERERLFQEFMSRMPASVEL